MSNLQASEAQASEAQASEAQASGAQAGGARASGARASGALPGIESHPHASAVLGAALAGLPRRAPSHAYLLRGPAGAGKRALARAFAGELLAAGSSDPQAAQGVRERVQRGAHPDLTWVAPSGAAEMLVGDVDRAVVAAAAMRPFEAARRVFVIDGPERLNEQAANRLLKTLEEPPAYVHLLLVSDRAHKILPTIVSRCVHVRFDAPSAETIAQGLLAAGLCDADEQALACARLALGDAARARSLAGPEGRALRAAAEVYVRACLAGDDFPGDPSSGPSSDRSSDRSLDLSSGHPSGRSSGASSGDAPPGDLAEGALSDLLDAARAAGTAAGEALAGQLADELELAPAKERKRLQREAADAARRAERRARALALDSALQLAELWLRDVVCVQEGASELVHALDRMVQLQQDAAMLDADAARSGVVRVRDTRLRLQINVGEQLALEALAYRLRP